MFGTRVEFASSLDLSTLNGLNGFIIQGIGPDDMTGGSVSSAGDVNDDGIDDVIITGSPFYNSHGYDGESYVVFGSNNGFAPVVEESITDKQSPANKLFKLLINDHVFRDPDGDNLTYSATLANDLPLPSWLIFDPNTVGFKGIPLSKDLGDLEIKLIATDSSNKSTSINFTLTVTDNLFPAVVELQQYLNDSNGFIINGINDFDRLGESVNSAGDVNGDGIDDLIIGAPNAGSDSYGTGESYVVFGRSSRFANSFDLSTLDGTNGFVIKGIDDFDRLGNSVSGAGDVNGDGIDDLIIGAPNADSNGKGGAGESYVVFGS